MGKIMRLIRDGDQFTAEFIRNASEAEIETYQALLVAMPMDHEPSVEYWAGAVDGTPFGVQGKVYVD